MQALLFQAGYLDWRYSDGTFDYYTLSAVKHFQRDNPGTASADGSGVYGAATKAALLSYLGMTG
jgi:peptidoglycan hydrolase-like protein with peptidoglycan-binding domain